MAEYIERGALLDDIDAAEKNSGMGIVIAQTLKRYVKRQPAADVTPVIHAHWIPHIGQNGRGDGWNCSAPECGEFSCCAGAYCPNCGAKMDERGGK